MLAYPPSGNLFTVSFLTSAAPVNTASVFMMPALAQLAGKQSTRPVYFKSSVRLCVLIADCAHPRTHRAGNIVLLQFLVGLKEATEDELVGELVCNVLKSSPDILARYFQETRYAYTPRLKSAWQDSVKLLKKARKCILTPAAVGKSCPEPF